MLHCGWYTTGLAPALWSGVVKRQHCALKKKVWHSSHVLSVLEKGSQSTPKSFAGLMEWTLLHYKWKSGFLSPACVEPWNLGVYKVQVRQCKMQLQHMDSVEVPTFYQVISGTKIFLVCKGTVQRHDSVLHCNNYILHTTCTYMKSTNHLVLEVTRSIWPHLHGNA